MAILFEEVDPQSVVKYGIAKPAKPEGKTDAIFEIADLIEKPTVAEAPSNLAIAARYVFSPEIFEFIKKTEPGRNNEIQITDSIRLMLAQGYFEAFFRFSLADPEFGQDFGRYAKTHL